LPTVVRPRRKQELQRLGCRLRVLRLEDNPAIPHDLRTEIAQALLQLNLPSILHSQVGSSGGGGGGERRSAAKAPPPLAQAAAWKPGGLAADATVPQATPHATVSDIALAAPHAPTLLAEAAARSLGGIALVDCGGFGDAGAAALLPLPPQPQRGTPDAASPSMALSSIVSLRLSACRLTNASVHVLGEFISLGCVPALASLRLDANRLTLNEPPPAGIAYDGQVRLPTHAFALLTRSAQEHAHAHAPSLTTAAHAFGCGGNAGDRMGASLRVVCRVARLPPPPLRDRHLGQPGA